MTRAASLICTVAFRQPRGWGRQETEGVCRVARLLAVAHRVEKAIASGELADHKAAAAQLGISQPHMSQIANLVHLAPDIQEALVTERLHASENQLRAALRSMVWGEQREYLRGARCTGSSARRNPRHELRLDSKYPVQYSH